MSLLNMFKKSRSYHIELDFYIKGKKVDWRGTTFICKNFDYKDLDILCKSEVDKSLETMDGVKKDEISYRIVNFYKLN